MSLRFLLLLSILLIPRVSTAIYEGIYTKTEARYSQGENGLEVYYESGDATFKKISKTKLQFKIYSSIRNFSCETEDNAVITLHGKDARYKHKNGCDISFSFTDSWVFISASEECDNNWCGVHAYGSLSGLYNKKIIFKTSYDCAKATTYTENTICWKEELANMDVELKRFISNLKGACLFRIR